MNLMMNRYSRYPSYLCSLLVDLYLFKRSGARLDPEYKSQDNFFERDVFIESIVNFYERVRGKPIEKLGFPTQK